MTKRATPNRLLLAACAIGIALPAGCRPSAPTRFITPPPEPVVLSDFHQAADSIGAWVTIRGEVSQTKIPQIIGIDINADFEGRDLRGQLAEASGVLETWTVTQESLDAADAKVGPIANRGAGQFFRLVRLDPPKRLAQALPIDQSSD